MQRSPDQRSAVPTVPFNWDSRLAPAFTPTIATEKISPMSSKMLRAAFGVFPKKRTLETREDTMIPDTSKPPALPSPTEAPKAGTWINPIRKPRIIPRDNVSRSVAVLGLANLKFLRSLFSKAAFSLA